MTPPERTPSKVTVEDLLRLKRAERPSPEFWTTFESQLRAKQLAAIMKRDPWWKAALVGGWAGLRRHQAACGAVAAVALLLVTVREYRGFGTAPSLPTTAPVTEESVRSEADVASRLSPRRESVPVTTEPAAAGSTLGVESPAAGTLVSAPADERPEHAPAPADRLPGETVSSATFVAMAGSHEAAALTPSAVLAPAVSLNSAAVAAFVSDGRDFEPRVAAARTPISEPLAQVASPRDVRRARLLAALVPADAAAVASERVSDRAREQQIFETVSRMGRVGDPFTLRF